MRLPFPLNPSSVRRSSRRRFFRALIVLGGICFTQAVLYGPSLLGYRILLPLDILKVDRCYLPQLPEMRGYVPLNRIMIDEVTAIEMRRWFAVREVREGRLPLWNPYNFCGAPFLAANNTAVFSLFRLPDYLWPGPTVIAWVQLLKSLVGGCGAFLFFRRAMRVRFWAATLGAWAFPVLGFFVLWRAYPVSFTAIWLPWLLLAVDAAIRKPGGLGGPLLAVVTCLMLFSGHAATAVQVLLVCALFALFRLVTVCGWPAMFGSRGLKSCAAVVGGLALGALLSAPQSLPTVEYLRTSFRVQNRAEGLVEEPGIGMVALPQFVLPNFYGSEQRGSRYVPPGGRWDADSGVYLSRGSRAEGGPQAYAGLILTLVVAPLAWASRRHRAWSAFWIGGGLFAAAHLLQVPILASVFDLPPLDLLKNNRLTFFTAWCVVAMAVLGIDVLLRRRTLRFRWSVVPIVVLAGLGAWCLYRHFVLPRAVLEGLRPSSFDPVELAQGWFAKMYLAGALQCGLGLFLWAVILWRANARWLPLGVILCALGELLWVNYGVNPQCDPALYYPRIATLEALSRQEPGRVCGYYCLPACLNLTHDLKDIRGYDGVDPARLIELLRLVEDQHGQRFVRPVYAYTQLFPAVDSPIMDMLNVRYRIDRGRPPGAVEPLLSGNDYFVLERPTALARAFIPRRSRWSSGKEETLAQLRSVDFDPRRMAWLELEDNQPRPELPSEPSAGKVRIDHETSSHIVLDVAMESAGVVVLADLWYKGWKATLDGVEVPILRANHALRGVVVPAGKSRLEFRYEPASFRLGVTVFLGSFVLLVVWMGASSWRSRRQTPM